VSLCRVGNDDLPARAEQIDVRLIDQPDANNNLDFVLLDTVRLVEQLRREGHTVLIHCVQAQSRTPTVAALYGARLRGIGIDVALADLCDVLPNADPIPEFREALQRVHPVGCQNQDE
jgi:ADP-ribosyl-[dinitrogen reductase] hydrolase